MSKDPNCNLAKQLTFALVCLTGTAGVLAQADRVESLAGEKAAERARRAELPRNYNIDLGPFAVALSASFYTEYNDNVLYTKVNARDDVILRPEVTFNALWPITELNALAVSLGVGYQYYIDNTPLNSDAPLISPGSAVELTVFVGDFRFRLSDRFSYQESLYYWSAVSRETGEFVNLSNIGKFGRLQNNAALQVDWDLHDLVLGTRFEHENFVSYERQLEYLTRSTDRLSLWADLYASPKIKYGVETAGSWNQYDKSHLPDHWRASAGPFADVTLSPYINFRIGAGYSGVYLENPRPGTESTIQDFYAYGRMTHRMNKFLTYGINVGKEHQTGWSGANRELVYAGLGLTWMLFKDIDLSQYFSFGSASEAAGYAEDYDYIQAGLRVGWHFAKRWTALLGYDHLLKDSEYNLLDYDQNRVSVGVEYRF